MTTLLVTVLVHAARIDVTFSRRRNDDVDDAVRVCGALDVAVTRTTNRPNIVEGCLEIADAMLDDADDDDDNFDLDTDSCVYIDVAYDDPSPDLDEYVHLANAHAKLGGPRVRARPVALPDAVDAHLTVHGGRFSLCDLALRHVRQGWREIERE